LFATDLSNATNPPWNGEFVSNKKETKQPKPDDENTEEKRGA
jgi:hypothetical protein